jgi:hypothetical protein
MDCVYPDCFFTYTQAKSFLFEKKTFKEIATALNDREAEITFKVSVKYCSLLPTSMHLNIAS